MTTQSAIPSDLLMRKYENAVFVSYAWEGESERIVDELELAFAKSGIKIVRDKKDLEYKGSIKGFEQRIGQGQCIILVISDKYLRSEHCMYELVEIEKNQRLHERIFPIVLEDARIFKPVENLVYIRDWDKKIEELDQAIRQVGIITNLAESTSALGKYTSIRASFDHLSELLRDLNALTPKDHAASGFSTLVSAVEATLGNEPPKHELDDEIVQIESSSSNANLELLGEKHLQRNEAQVLSQNGPSISDENNPESRWLGTIGLKENPFRHQDAEEKDPYLPIYFSRFTELRGVTIADLTNHRSTWLFSGEKGSGKTTLRKFLAAQGIPAKNKANIICIEFDKVKIEQLIATNNEIDEFPTRFFQSLYEKCLKYFPNEILSKNILWKNQGDIQANLSNLSDWLKIHDIDGVLCLVDPSEEFFTWKKSPIPTASFLELMLSFPQMGSIGLRYFLPVKVKEELQTKYPFLHQNQYNFMQIEWDEDSLKKLIGNRMIALSLEPLTPFRSLGQICDDEKNLATLVDAEIASLAQGNPRAAIWLANRLIEVHCQDPLPSERISIEEWDEVKAAWWSYGEHRILLDRSKQNRLRVLGSIIYYRNHELVLTGRSNQLLRCLAQSKNGFRSKEELIGAGWPGEYSAGVSEKAISEAIRRMKEELKKEMKQWGFEGFEWIKSVRNRGYRLVYPGMITITGEEEYD
jgi:DNA-binding winged helix-turn-helix (wHTH) protein